MRRPILIAVTLTVLAFAACSVHYEGRLHAIDPAQSVTIEGSTAWSTPPKLVVSNRDNGSLFVIAPQMPLSAQLHAVHVDTRTGSQHRTMISLGPGAGFRNLEPPGDAGIEVRGLRWNRPVFRLTALRDGTASGFERVDSATGEVRIVLRDGAQTLLARKALNCSEHLQLLSQVWADPRGAWIAAVVREPAGWRLHLFSRRARPRRAGLTGWRSDEARRPRRS